MSTQALCKYVTNRERGVRWGQKELQPRSIFDRENFSWSIESESWGKPECENLLYLLDISSKVYKVYQGI